MIKNLFSFLCVFVLGACVPAHIARLNSIRVQKLPILETQLAAADLEAGDPLYVRVFKEEGVLETWVRNRDTGFYQPFKTYEICRYSGTLGPKLMRGDMQAPEGFYDVTEEQLFPQSKYDLAMNIGYPNVYDEFLARTGDRIMIHGGCKSEGCFAMTNEGIEEIYLLAEQSLRGGSESIPVHIFPFRMTDENMRLHGNSKWTPFWKNLKQGYDMFEQSHYPPRVAAQGGEYLFMPQGFAYAGI